MAILLGTGISISLDSIGCFRAELARACGALPASMRRWHRVQVRAGRLKEGRDFIIVRQSPHERHHDDDVFYFYEAIKICQKRTAKKQIDLSLIQLDTLRAHGLQMIDGQVVRRNQLRLFEIGQSANITSASEGIHPDLFSTLILRQYNGVNVLQRCTDGYIKVDKLCQAVGENWSRFEEQLSDPSTKLGVYAQMLNSTPRSYKMPLVQELECDDPIFQGNWADPRIVRRIAEGIDIVLANLVEQWEIDLEGRLRSLMTNSEKITCVV
ncbi:MAG: KilA-N domain-containing protein [Phormidium tanganyikae FI6-MK23]|jgi:hypothetical protein|nr:KilA-N domain-containing protein [Phormidium tanganyikae FI6-MK23]